MNKILFIILDFLGIAIISLLSFGLFPITGGMIVSYVFLLIAMLMQLLPMAIFQNVKDVAYKAGVYVVFAIYLLIQITISFLGYTLLYTSSKVIIILSTILFLLCMACIIIILQVGTTGDKKHKKENTKAFFIDKVICNLEMIKAQVKETEIIAEIEKVIEKARYSNLNSPEEAAQTELKIIEEIEHIEQLIATAKIMECKVSCDKLGTLFSEREMLCKLYK